MYPWWLRLQKHSILTGCARKPPLLRGYDLKSLQWLCFLIPMIVLQNPVPSRNEGSVLLVSRMQSVQCPQHLRQRCLPEAELEEIQVFHRRSELPEAALFFCRAPASMRLFFNGFSVVRSPHWAPCASLGLLNLAFLGRCLPPRQMYPWWLRLQKHSILTGCARKPPLLRGYDLKSLQWLCFLIPMIVLQNPVPSRNEG